MIVTIISECESKSWIKTRRILSSYLFQIGSRVWQGHISQEGLNDLKESLSSSASKNTSVICYRHQGTRPSMIEWIVGSKKNFNDDGIYCYSTSTTIRDYNKLKIAHADLMLSIVELSGLCHDLGKATIGFQKKLECSISNTKSKPDPIRHELMSTLLLASLLSASEDEKLFTLVSSEAVKTFFEESIMKIKDKFLLSIQKHQDNLIKNQKQEDFTKDFSNEFPTLEQITSEVNFLKNPISMSLLWLVLTHHKMPNGKYSVTQSQQRRQAKEERIFKIKIDYMYLNVTAESNLNDFTSFTKSSPWESEKWRLAFIDCINKIKKASSEVQLKTLHSNESFITDLVYKARPSLILADYLESYSKQRCNLQDPSIITYANTVVDEESAYWADTLISHLSKVATRARSYFDRMFCRDVDDMTTLPSLNIEQRPSQLVNPDNPGLESPFYWQYAAFNQLKTMSITGGLFGIISSKTGSGKTKACPLIMSAISENLRFTLAIGMRNLATQTYNSYISDLIGFSSENTSVLIGSNSIESHEDIDKYGSATTDDDTDELVAITNSNYQDSEIMDIYTKRKESELVCSPITVMTIDHIIDAVHLRKGVLSKHLLHLSTTDLILDEIDDYDAKDLISIGKLVYLKGLFGKKVLVSSATTSPAIIQSLMTAYHKGYQLFSQTQPSKIEPAYVFISHNEPYINIAKTEKIEEAFKEYSAFMNSFTEKVLQEPVRHKPKMIDISSEKHGYSHEKLTRACKELHDDNHVMADKTKVSIGFVRFNNVKEAQRFAIYLNDNQFNDFEHKVICYHSKMLMLDRKMTEDFLSDATNRNKSEFFTHKKIQEILNMPSMANCADLMIIVCTTNILETGRDHDYDWMVTEPISDKSLIQASGRIWRHRRLKTANTHNIGILSKTIKAYQNLPDSWGFPGIESDRSANGKSAKYPASYDYSDQIMAKLKYADIVANRRSDQQVTALECIHRHCIEHKVDSTATLLKPTKDTNGLFSTLDYVRLSDYLLENKDQDIRESNLFSFIDRNDAKLNSLHWASNKFRAKNKNRTPVKISQKNLSRHGFNNLGWKAVSTEKQKVSDFALDVSTRSIRNNRFLIDYDHNEVLAELVVSCEPSLLEIYFSCSLEISDKVFEVFYNQYIGFSDEDIS